MKSQFNCSRTIASGFTLLELIAVIGIIMVLATLGTTVAQKAIRSSEKAREMSAGRNLISAYQSAANDREGQFLRAYDDHVSSDEAVSLPDGKVVDGEPLHRYPYRLAPYFNYQIKGVILVNDNAKRIDEGEHYQVSLSPAFGINQTYLGGEYRGGTNVYEDDTVTTRGDASSSIIAFVTAGNGLESGKPVPGFFKVQAPNTHVSVWSSKQWKRDSNPSGFGNIDPRYDGKAITVFLDGSIRMMSMEELDDMRLWSMRAAESDDSDYRATKIRGGGRL